MIIRIESSVTLQVEDRHYLKESRTLEMDHRDIISLLAANAEMAERYEDLEEDDPLVFEAIQDAIMVGFDAVKFPLWEAIDDQVKELTGENDEE